MDKGYFLYQLRSKLSNNNGLTEDEIEKTVAYYSEIIEDLKENGMSESDAINSLGPIDEIIKNTLKDQDTKQKDNTVRNIVLAVVILLCPLWIPLIGAVISAMLGVIATVLGIVIGSVALVALCFIAAAALTVIAFVLLPKFGTAVTLLLLGTAILMISFGLIAIPISHYVIKAFKHVWHWSVNNIKKIKERRNNNEI